LAVLCTKATTGWVRVINLVVKADSSESVETAFEQHARSGVRRSMPSFDGVRAGNKTFTESLILAQDERWRRA
jgi:hypothetical protein